MPLVMTGVRIALVQVWATATIAALVAGPGLGRIITRGFANQATYRGGGRRDPGRRSARCVLEGLAVLAERYADPMRRAAPPAAPAAGRAVGPSSSAGIGLSVARVSASTAGAVGYPSDTRGACPRDTEGGTPMRMLRTLSLAAAGVVLLATAGCGDDLEDPDTGSGTRRRRQGLGRRRRPGLHRDAGDGRDLPAAARGRGLRRRDQAGDHPRRLRRASSASGNVDIVPDYLAGLTDFLNTEANGPDADAGVQQRPRRDAGRARAAGRGRGHLDPRRRPRPPTRTPSS